MNREPERLSPIGLPPAIERDLEFRRRAPEARGGQSHRHRQALHDHRLRVLRDWRIAGDADPRPTGDTAFRLCRRVDLQPDLHDARHRDDVPVCHPDAGRRGHLFSAEDAGRARPGLSASHRTRLLVLSFSAAPSSSSPCFLVSRLTAAGSCTRRFRRVPIRQGSTPTSGSWASPLSRYRLCARPSRSPSRS